MPSKQRTSRDEPRPKDEMNLTDGDGRQGTGKMRVSRPREV